MTIPVQPPVLAALALPDPSACPIRTVMAALSAMNEVRSIDILPRLASGPTGNVPYGVTQYSPRPGRIRYAAESLKLAARVQPDVIYCGHLFMVPLAAAVARVYRAKLVVHLHGLELWQPLARALPASGGRNVDSDRQHARGEEDVELVRRALDGSQAK